MWPVVNILDVVVVGGNPEGGGDGVEDKLQDEVKSTLELLRHADIKIWMLNVDR